MFIKNIITAFSFYLASFSLVASVHISLGERVNLGQAGLSIRVFKNSEGRPIQLPSSYRIKNSNEKVYRMKDLWKYKQNLGRWENSYVEFDAVLMLYKTTKLDSDFIKVDMVDSKFDSQYASDNWSMDDIDKWIYEYFGFNLGEIIGKINLSTGDEAMVFQVNDQKADNQKFIVILPGTKYLNKNIVFYYLFNDKSIKTKTAIRGLVKSVESLEFFNSPRLNSISDNLKSNDTADNMVLNNISNLKGWEAIQSSDYYILTNCTQSPTSNAFIKQVTDSLETDKIIYSFFYKEKKSLKDKFVVRIFKDRDDYIAYVGEQSSWTGGLWMPSKRELVLYKPKLTSKGKIRFFKTLKHEGFHQYIHYALDELETGAWFNEGNAVFMENVELKGGKICIYPDLTRLKYLQGQVSTPNFSYRVQMLFKKSYSEFYNDGQVDDNYNLSWGIIYFLYTGYSDIYYKYKRDYSKVLQKYYNGLYLFKNEKKAFEYAWNGIDMKIFANDLAYYFKYKANSSKVLKY